MKFEEMYIEANHSQKAEVIRVLNKNGFKIKKYYSFNEICASRDGFISTYKDGTYGTFGECIIEDQYYSYEDFMKKYDSCEMIELINKAKSELRMNDSELSLALGKSRQYIGKMLRLPQSKKVQDKVIKEINALLTRDKFGKLSIGNHTHMSIENVEVNGGEIFVTGTIQDPKDKQISDLKKANEQQKLVIDKLDDQLIKAEKIHNEDVKTIEAKDKEIKYLNERRIEYKDVSIKKQRMVDSLTKENELLTGKLEHSRRETDYFVNQFKRVEDELKELKSSHTTSKALNWFFVVAIILAAIVWKAYNG